MGMGVQQGVADEQLLAARYEQNLLAEEHSTDTVCNDRERIHFKIDDILVSPRLINIAVVMNAKVERHSMLQQSLVKSRQQHIAVTSELVDGNSEETVVFSRIAAHYGGVAVAPRPVCCQQFPLQGILQVHEFRFVELQISHFSDSD